jgi:hypothetical protein
MEGSESEVLSALEMLANVYAAEDDIWLPLIKAKETTADLSTANGARELLTLYSRAEMDYLCMLSFNISTCTMCEHTRLFSYSHSKQTY